MNVQKLLDELKEVCARHGLSDAIAQADFLAPHAVFRDARPWNDVPTIKPANREIVIRIAGFARDDDIDV